MAETTPAEELREAAKRIRRDAAWPTEDLAVADWLDAATEQAALYEAQGAWASDESYALKVARACLGAEGE
jgi:hypothetical protein